MEGTPLTQLLQMKPCPRHGDYFERSRDGCQTYMPHLSQPQARRCSPWWSYGLSAHDPIVWTPAPLATFVPRLLAGQHVREQSNKPLYMNGGCGGVPEDRARQNVQARSHHVFCCPYSPLDRHPLDCGPNLAPPLSPRAGRFKEIGSSVLAGCVVFAVLPIPRSPGRFWAANQPGRVARECLRCCGLLRPDPKTWTRAGVLTESCPSMLLAFRPENCPLGPGTPSTRITPGSKFVRPAVSKRRWYWLRA